MSGKPNPNYWTEEEVALLRANKPVPTRKLHDCYNKAWKLGILYAPKGMHFREQHEKSLACRDAIIAEVKATGNIRATGRKFGLSYTTISVIAKKEGLTNNPSPKERMGKSIQYDGITWVWSVKKCKRGTFSMYWRESSGKRRTLSRYIYEKEVGPIPRGYDIIFKNGDKNDLRVDNLLLVTRSERMLLLQKDPAIKIAMIAGAAMGRLNEKLREKMDPDFKNEVRAQRAENCRKMVLENIKKKGFKRRKK